MRKLLASVILSVVMLGACGSNSKQQTTGPLTNNWQFSFGNPGTDQQLFSGGFLLQSGNSVSGSVNYSIVSADGTQQCNGAAPFTGTVNGSQVTLLATAGGQAFAFTGNLSNDQAGNPLMGGAWTSAAGGCGTAQNGQWAAKSIKALTGPFQGTLHSGGSETMNIEFPITGTLTQGDNIGASSATVSGTINLAGYPCLSGAALNGQISGNNVILNMIGSSGLNNGVIGNTNPLQGGAAFEDTSNTVHGSYTVDTSACSAVVGKQDVGNICLDLGSGTACSEPISLTPASLTFPLQIVGGPAVSQLITLTNQTQSSISGLTLSFFGPSSDFTGQNLFTESDTCGAPGFSLAAQKSCTITVTFNPLQSCPWDPTSSQVLPAQCPFSWVAPLTVTGAPPATWDPNATFAALVSATANSAGVPSTPELDFGWQNLGASGLPQSLSFTNQGLSPVTILPGIGQPCIYPYLYPPTPGTVPGVQVVYLEQTPGVPPFGACDVDSATQKPNFRIAEDHCSGRLLMPQASCMLSIAFSPQAMAEPVPTNGDFYFLELNTLGEPDSGRFPVELKSNSASVLRMSPAAGFTFGPQLVGTTSVPQTLTLSNSSTNSAIVFPAPFFTSSSDYLQTNNCGTGLSAGGSCTVSIQFAPTKRGSDSGIITITTDNASGTPQMVYLRGLGQ